MFGLRIKVQEEKAEALTLCSLHCH